MSGDETFALLSSGVISLIVWTLWFSRILTVSRLASGTAVRAPVLLAPWFSAVVLFAVLRTAAAHDVRDDPKYLFFYQVFGAAWVGLVVQTLPRFGVSVRDDVAERGNLAASFAIAGALVGATLCFAGSNIGDGPGWWVVAFTGGLATAAFLWLWRLLERASAVAESVAVERDVAAGLRLAGWLVGTGLVLGRAAAGDWTGPVAATVDFGRLGWPAAGLLALEVVLSRWLRATPATPRPSWFLAGVVPAAVHAGAACAWVLATRPWS